MKMGKIPAVLIRSCILAFIYVSVCAAAPPPIVEKNLFAQDRKPPSDELPSPTSQPTKPAMSPRAIQLDGVLIYGDTKKALVRVKGQAPGSDDRRRPNSPYITVQEGERVGGYLITKIEPKSIVLERDGQITEVRLFSEGKVSPPPVPMPPIEQPQPAQAGQVPPQGAPGMPTQQGHPGMMPGQAVPEPQSPMANVPPGTPTAGGVVVSPPAVPGGQDQPVITVNPDVNESDDEEIAPDDEQIGDDDVSAEESAEP